MYTGTRLSKGVGIVYENPTRKPCKKILRKAVPCLK